MMDIFRTRVNDKIRLFTKDETPFAVRRHRTNTKIVGAYRNAQGQILVTYRDGLIWPILEIDPWYAAFNAAIDYFWASTPRFGDWVKCEGGMLKTYRPGALYRVHDGQLEVAQTPWVRAHDDSEDAKQAWRTFYPNLTPKV